MIKQLSQKAIDKSNFGDLKGYINFAKEFLKYLKNDLQAVIVSQNENHYQFYQYNKEGNFRITRPINSNLMYDSKTYNKAAREFLKITKNIKTIDKKDASIRDIINNFTYTTQQSIGAALDALPAGKANTARKLNGDLFEDFVRLIIQAIGVKCTSGVVKLPVIVDDKELFKMRYQHDLIIEDGDTVKVIGSIKTSSKDRIDKIFIDKFLHNKLKETETPHIAIFLNDVQRKKTKKENKYGINVTFLPGHFKGYTVKLNPLDGVYYCDIRPNMRTEDILKDHIDTFDKLLVEDIWEMIK